MQKNLATVFLCFTITSCSSSSDENSDTPPTHAAILGSWERCDPEFSGGSYHRNLTINNNGTWSITTTEYSNSGCNDESSIRDTWATEFTYEIDGTTLTEDGIEVFAFNINDITHRDQEGNLYPTCYDIVYADDYTLYLGFTEGQYNCDTPALRPVELYYGRGYFKMDNE